MPKSSSPYYNYEPEPPKHEVDFDWLRQRVKVIWIEATRSLSLLSPLKECVSGGKLLVHNKSFDYISERIPAVTKGIRQTIESNGKQVPAPTKYADILKQLKVIIADVEQLRIRTEDLGESFNEEIVSAAVCNLADLLDSEINS